MAPYQASPMPAEALVAQAGSKHRAHDLQFAASETAEVARRQRVPGAFCVSVDVFVHLGARAVRVGVAKRRAVEVPVEFIPVA